MFRHAMCALAQDQQQTVRRLPKLRGYRNHISQVFGLRMLIAF
jgi:hypothetical protein